MWSVMLRGFWTWTSAVVVVPPPAAADVGLVAGVTLGGRLRQVRPGPHTRARRG